MFIFRTVAKDSGSTFARNSNRVFFYNLTLRDKSDRPSRFASALIAKSG